MKVGICLLTLNYLEWTKECLYTLEKYTPANLYDLCICDNGSTDGTKSFLTEKKYNWINLPENFGIPKGRNMCIKELQKKGHYDYFCQIHNDMLFTENWLEIMINEIQKHNKCLMLGCTNIINLEALFVPRDERSRIAVALRENITGRANLDPRLIKAEAYDKIGLYDENLDLQDCEDVDFNKRIDDAGYLFLSTAKAVIWHPWSVTRLSLPNAQKQIKNSQNYTKQKHNISSFEKWNYAYKKMVRFEGRVFVLYTVR